MKKIWPILNRLKSYQNTIINQLSYQVPTVIRNELIVHLEKITMVVILKCEFECQTLVEYELPPDPLISDRGFSVMLAAYTWPEFAGAGTT